MPRHDLQLRSLAYATDIDVLPDDAVVEQRDGYVVVRSPQNVGHYWGNFLLFAQPPEAGDLPRWEEAFEREISAPQPRTEHLAFGWDTRAAERGAAVPEFVEAGYRMEEVVALVARPEELVLHHRADRSIEVRPLDPAPQADAELWDGVIELQTGSREPGHTEEAYRLYAQTRTDERRARFLAGDGAWFVALDAGRVVASMGVIVTNGRARFQSVDTAESHRNRGIASRVLYETGVAAIEQFGAEQLVILADADYHAYPLYESLGFVARERALGLTWWPTSPAAAQHSTRARLARPV